MGARLMDAQMHSLAPVARAPRQFSSWCETRDLWRRLCETHVRSALMQGGHTRSVHAAHGVRWDAVPCELRPSNSSRAVRGPASTDVGTKLPMVTGPRSSGAGASAVGGGGWPAGCESTAKGALVARSSSTARNGAQLCAATL